VALARSSESLFHQAIESPGVRLPRACYQKQIAPYGRETTATGAASDVGWRRFETRSFNAGRPHCCKGVYAAFTRLSHSLY